MGKNCKHTPVSAATRAPAAASSRATFSEKRIVIYVQNGVKRLICVELGYRRKILPTQGLREPSVVGSHRKVKGNQINLVGGRKRKRKVVSARRKKS